MAYTPPSTSAVDFVLESYTAPSTSAVDLTMDSDAPTSDPPIADAGPPQTVAPSTSSAGSIDAIEELTAFVSSGANTTFTTASINTIDGAALYLFLAIGDATSATEQPSSIGGSLGLSWTLLEDGVISSNLNVRGDLYEAVADGGSGTIQLNFATTQDNILAKVVQVSGSGTPITVQSNSSDQGNSPQSVSLVSAPDSTSALLAGVAQNSTNGTHTPSTGWSLLGSRIFNTTPASPAVGMDVAYDLSSGSQSITWTNSSNSRSICTIVEIAPGVGGTPTVVSLDGSASTDDVAITSVLWEVISNTTGEADPTIRNATSLTLAEFDAPSAEGVVTIRLTVYDADLQSSTDTVAITIAGTPDPGFYVWDGSQLVALVEKVWDGATAQTPSTSIHS